MPLCEPRYRSVLVSTLVLAFASIAAGCGSNAAGDCPGGEILCANACIDVSVDPDNCGGCGVQCDIDQTCVDGVCTAGGCRGEMCDGACVDTTQDSAHCGGCGIACPLAQPFCVDGACSDTCPAPREECNGQCVDVLSDPDHCGECGNSCGSGVACVNGGCACEDTTQLDCGGGCEDVTANPDQCGSCGNECASAEYCTNSMCECRPGLTRNDDGDCVDPQSDPASCGPQGATCDGPTPLCQEGACVADCGGIFEQCGDACVNTETSIFHCGACGEACDNDELCVSGECVSYDPTGSACTACPCDACGGGELCCEFPGNDAQVICVEDDAAMCPGG